MSFAFSTWRRHYCGAEVSWRDSLAYVFDRNISAAAALPVSLGLHVWRGQCHFRALRNGTMHFIMLATLRTLSLTPSASSAHPSTRLIM